ncbi:hypothetical protein ACLMJK_006956 [Lecanora helva]
MSSTELNSTYKRPQTGWLYYLPTSWIPYVQLMRLDRPHGLWYFFLPHLFGATQAAIHLRTPPTALLTTSLIVFIGTIIMRGATCTWNDTVDAPFDRQVVRTRDRPVARGAVSPFAANIFTAVQTILSLAILLNLPSICRMYALPPIIGWILYPLAKRVTYYPQVVLGFPMAWGVFMGSAAMGSDPLQLFRAEAHGQNQPTMFVGAFYAANVLWTLFYEIIYSHQDASEDTKAGVKNIVLLYQGHTKPLLMKLAMAQVFFLVLAGYLGQAGFMYWICTVLGTTVTSAIILMKVRLDVPEDCAWWFKNGCCRFTGGAMMAGLLGDYSMTMLRS